MILTYRYRVKDATARKVLDRKARAVNLVWNYCGEVQKASRRLNRRWPTAFDLMKLTAGSSKDLDLNCYTIECVCKKFETSRNIIRRRPGWRGKKSLGWIPFRNHAVRVEHGRVRYMRKWYRFWDTRAIEQSSVRSGSFSQDARGRWYLNLEVEVATDNACGNGRVGIDLGLKTLAALSNGSKIENPRHFKHYADRLANAQRAGNKHRVRAVHAKISNARRHHLHIQSTKIVREHGLIVVGNVNAKSLGQTKMAKSIFDVSWSAFRQMLRYKALRHGAEYVEADERFSSVSCSACAARSGPKGRKNLRVREWTCGECGAVHDRDTNAAINILGLKCQPPVADVSSEKALIRANSSALSSLDTEGKP